MDNGLFFVGSFHTDFDLFSFFQKLTGKKTSKLMGRLTGGGLRAAIFMQLWVRKSVTFAQRSLFAELLLCQTGSPLRSAWSLKPPLHYVQDSHYAQCYFSLPRLFSNAHIRIACVPGEDLLIIEQAQIQKEGHWEQRSKCHSLVRFIRQKFSNCCTWTFYGDAQGLVGFNISFTLCNYSVLLKYCIKV